jgi:hypothetical protein
MRYLTPALVLTLAASGLMLAGGNAKPCPPEYDSPLPRQQQLEAAQLMEMRSPRLLATLLARYDAHPDPALLPQIDAVAAQHDAVWSRLYWHTDLASAQEQAKAEHKPILYLRMLGKLTDEYSCANSRFFRTALYANKEVSKLLHEKFVLVWESERPVPVVTIDFGDGRVLKRTITGNSAHYVLDAEGRVVDALPGLFDPATFTAIVTNAGKAAAMNDDQARRNYLEAAERALAADWTRDTQTLYAPAASVPRADATPAPINLADLGAAPVAAAPRADVAGERAFAKVRAERRVVAQVTGRPAAAPPAGLPPAGPPAAAVAARRAEGKMLVEGPLVRAVAPVPGEMLRNAVESADEFTWAKLANAYNARPQTHLDESSITLIRSQNPSAQPEAVTRMVDSFQQAMARDTVRNNYQFRRQVIGWLRESGEPMSLGALNARIYTELFLTPRNDPWLGLVAQDAYSALCDDGLAAPVK